MCLVTHQKEPIILTEDLIVYKEVNYENENIISKYYEFTWEKGRLNETDFEIEKFSWFHEFFDPKSSRYYYENKHDELISITKGFHAAISTTRLYDADIDKTHILKFIIPAGAIIYKDPTGLIVANKMILPE